MVVDTSEPRAGWKKSCRTHAFFILFCRQVMMILSFKPVANPVTLFKHKTCFVTDFKPNGYTYLQTLLP